MEKISVLIFQRALNKFPLQDSEQKIEMTVFIDFSNGER